MGVDANMSFSTQRKLSDEDIGKLASKFYDAFQSLVYLDTFRKCICRSYKNPEFEYMVNLSGRYYGPGYERGPIYAYVAIAEWLEHNIPGCQVFYGGDGNLDKFGPEERESFKHYFFELGHSPYLNFGSLARDLKCLHCVDWNIANVGGGRGDEFLRCSGCGNHYIYRNGTLIDIGDEDFFSWAQKQKGKTL